MENEYIVVAFVNNQISVLNRITSAYLKRHINIESLNVSESYIKGISTVVISAITTADITERIVNQLGNVIDIHNVNYYRPEELIYQELGLYKVHTKILKQKKDCDFLLNQSNGRIIEINSDYVIVEKSGTRNELEKLRDKLDSKMLLAGYSRSGNVVLHREESIQNLLQKVS
jgi:acetolactate synthase I/III small subunit